MDDKITTREELFAGLHALREYAQELMARPPEGSEALWASLQDAISALEYRVALLPHEGSMRGAA